MPPTSYLAATTPDSSEMTFPNMSSHASSDGVVYFSREDSSTTFLPVPSDEPQKRAHKSDPPCQPWFEDRRRVARRSGPHSPKTQASIAGYSNR
jgi:hypothetical protein